MEMDSDGLRQRDQPVLAHFASLDIARDLLGAASLDLETAMRPYDSLSGGEQAVASEGRVTLAMIFP